METAEAASHDVQTLAELEAEVQKLEERLDKTRASAVALRARILAEGLSLGGARTENQVGMAQQAAPLPFAGEISESTDPADEEQTSSLPQITLADLPPQHILRIKWHLEREYPHPGTDDHIPLADSPRMAASHEGRLRLFGLLDDGSPWECAIRYSDLMNGVSLGREGSDADIVLDDPGISRCHLHLALTDDGVMVSDEHSTNGTRVNDHPLGSYQRHAALNDGDVLRVAGIELKAELL